MNQPDQFLQKQVEEGKTPSINYMIFNADGIVHQFIFGLADIKNQIEAHRETTYHVYSVTKTFTALAVLQLAEQNKLDIRQPVKKYLPGFPYPSNITIRQLLTHTAGIPNPVPLSWIHLVNEHPSFNRNSFFTQIFKKHRRVKSPPNTRFQYSNLGYVLLGQLIETVSGLSYEQYIADYVITKLQLQPKHLGFEITDISKHAKGYHKQMSFSNLILGLFIDKAKYMGKTEQGWKPFNSFYTNGAPYGGLIGNSTAFVKYIQELLKPGCRLLSDEYKKMLFTENLTDDKRPTGMCMAWFTGRLNSQTYFAHAGGGGGYYCETRIYPEKGMGSIVFFNRTGMKDERFLDKIDPYFID